MKTRTLIASLCTVIAFVASVTTSHAQENTIQNPADSLLLLSSHIESVVDLDAYVSAVTAQDTNASSVRVSEQSVSLTYKQPVKLFAFIPLTVPTTATVNALGTVSVSYPWYAFLATKNNARLKSNLDVFAGRIARSESLAILEVQARVAEALRIVMSDNLEGRDTLAEESQ